MVFGPLRDLGALGVMNGLSHTEDAESAKNGDVVGGKLTTLLWSSSLRTATTAASPSNRCTATAADVAQIFLGAIHHKVWQEV
jgi:hypothetical protein